jgi:hypothetical protein
LEQNFDKIDWRNLSKNPNAIHILKKNNKRINWDQLSSNSNAIELLENNYDRIVWSHLSSNPNAIHILEQSTQISNNVKQFWRANENFPTDSRVEELD